MQASETSTGAVHDVRRMGEAVKKTGAIFVVDAITGLGTMPLDIDAWGLDIVIGGSQKAFMVPPGLGISLDQPEGLGAHGNREAAALLFQSQARKKFAANGESAWTASTALMLALNEALQYIKKHRHGEADRQCGTIGARDAGGMPGAGSRTVLRRIIPARRSPR